MSIHSYIVDPTKVSIVRVAELTKFDMAEFEEKFRMVSTAMREEVLRRMLANELSLQPLGFGSTGGLQFTGTLWIEKQHAPTGEDHTFVRIDLHFSVQQSSKHVQEETDENSSRNS